MKTKFYYIILIITSVILASCISVNAGGKTIKASSKIVSRKIKTAEFSGIATATSIDIEFVQGSKNVTLVASDNVIDLIDVSVRKGILYVDYKPNSFNSITCGDNNCPVLKVSAPDIHSFTTMSSGNIIIRGALNVNHDLKFGTLSSGDIKAKSVKGNELILQTNSSGDIEIYDALCRTLSLQCNSSGDIEVKNTKADKVHAQCNSSGDIEVSGTCVTANLQSNSSGDINATDLCSETLNANSNSSGDIRCRRASRNTNSNTNSSGEVIIR